MNRTHHTTIWLQEIECPKCGCLFAVTYEYSRRRLVDCQMFCCPNGCQLYNVKEGTSLEPFDPAERNRIMDGWRQAKMVELAQVKDELSKTKSNLTRAKNKIKKLKEAPSL